LRKVGGFLGSYYSTVSVRRKNVKKAGDTKNEDLTTLPDPASRYSGNGKNVNVATPP